MKILWLLPVVVIGVLWWMRRSANHKAKGNA